MNLKNGEHSESYVVERSYSEIRTYPFIPVYGSRIRHVQNQKPINHLIKEGVLTGTLIR